MCPFCGRRHPLWKHGTYSRGIYDINTGHAEINILRYYCSCCGGTVSILPDFVLPYKYYSSYVISLCLYLLFCCERSLRSIARNWGIGVGPQRFWLKQWWFNRVNLTTVLRDRFGINVMPVTLSSYIHSPYITDEGLGAFLCACELVLGGEIESCHGNCDLAGIASCDHRNCAGLLQGLQRHFSGLAFPMGVF